MKPRRILVRVRFGRTKPRGSGPNCKFYASPYLPYLPRLTRLRPLIGYDKNMRSRVNTYENGERATAPDEAFRALAELFSDLPSAPPTRGRRKYVLEYLAV